MDGLEWGEASAVNERISTSPRGTAHRNLDQTKSQRRRGAQQQGGRNSIITAAFRNTLISEPEPLAMPIERARSPGRHVDMGRSRQRHASSTPIASFAESFVPSQDPDDRPAFSDSYAVDGGGDSAMITALESAAAAVLSAAAATSGTVAVRFAQPTLEQAERNKERAAKVARQELRQRRLAWEAGAKSERQASQLRAEKRRSARVASVDPEGRAGIEHRIVQPRMGGSSRSSTPKPQHIKKKSSGLGPDDRTVACSPAVPMWQSVGSRPVASRKAVPPELRAHVRRWLRELRLGVFSAALVPFGPELENLAETTDAELAGIGLAVPQRKRFRRALARAGHGTLAELSAISSTNDSQGRAGSVVDEEDAAPGQRSPRQHAAAAAAALLEEDKVVQE